ncbi:unnamed protein product [Penicillium olsonii]|nr:unnamed protein product [Penicillium olsonii]
MGQPNALRVAILKNLPKQAKGSSEVVLSITNLVKKSLPDARIENFNPIDGGDFPEAQNFDLIILTGGLSDLTIPEESMDGWIQDTIRFIRRTTATYPHVKMLGICWGHQIICHAFGGRIGTRQEGPLVGIDTIHLNSTGKKFLSTVTDSWRMYKFHKRVVRTPPANLVELSPKHEIFVSRDEQILTLQAHPEMTASIIEDLLKTSDVHGSYFSGKSADQIGVLLEETGKDQDGRDVWDKIMCWATSHK